jgi:RNA polymerase sigma-70 factor (ECF subfamily)
MISVNCMPLLVGEGGFRQRVKELKLQASTVDADAVARRLASGAGRGDEAAFQELYDLYHDRVFRLAFVLSRGDEGLAQEVVQSVFLTAASKLRRVENEEHLWNWLARITRQQLSKAWRQKGPAPVNMIELPELADSRQPESVLEESLDAALLLMELEDQQLIEWFYFDGLGHSDIAERLNTTPKAVSSRLERARAKLRTLLMRKLSYET